MRVRRNFVVPGNERSSRRYRGNIASYVATEERRRMFGADRRQHHADRKNSAEDFGRVVVLD